MSIHRLVIACAMTLLAGRAFGQQVVTPGTPAAAIAAPPIAVIESVPLESMALVKNAPFSAEAVTEFTQILGDGNRIERRYASSMARDSSGRTRREEEIAMVGPLAATGPAPKLIAIVDPVAGFSYTLDENLRVALRNRLPPAKLSVPILPTAGSGEVWARKGVAATRIPGGVVIALPGGLQSSSAPFETSASKIVTEKLGTRSIEGVAAEGVRTTTTIPAGAIGNLMPIEIVAERWVSAELQMPVLITRRDPRSGETVYRLINIVRAEPPADLFAVSPAYEIRDGKLAWNVLKKF